MRSMLDRRIARLETLIHSDAAVTRLSDAELVAEVIASWRSRLASPDVDPELAQSAAICLAHQWEDPKSPRSDAQWAALRADIVLLERRLSCAKSASV